MQAFDVVILGGGPAGTATALSLRRHAPELCVALVERGDGQSPRIGETLPPGVRPLLEQMGVWTAFQHDGHLPAYGTKARWGTCELVDNDFVFSARGNGWHLDRRRFDAMLVAESTKAGATVIRPRCVSSAGQLPDDKLAVAFMTDGDIVQNEQFGRESNWCRALSHTTYCHEFLCGAEPLTAPTIRAAHSQQLDRACSDTWLAVGDAASTFDPLSSQGIVKALRSGIFASYAIADRFRGRPAGLRRFSRYVSGEFHQYLRTKQIYYAQEARWLQSPFWKRRQPISMACATADRTPLVGDLLGTLRHMTPEQARGKRLLDERTDIDLQAQRSTNRCHFARRLNPKTGKSRCD